MTKTALIILDGWGLASASDSNAISKAHTPVMDALVKKYPFTQLLTSGEDVGLPAGQMGNSEVGHLNLGAGRVVWQELANINKAVRERTIDKLPALTELFNTVKSGNGNLHLMGLVSDGGVHSHIEHLKHLCTIASDYGLKNVFIHAFTDGRDTDPQSGIHFLSDLQEHLNKTTGKIATVCGRYYAMDRDKRWERIKVAYDALVNGIGTPAYNWKEAVLNSYHDKVTDEFIRPIIVSENDGRPVSVIRPGDALLCFNFRTDRCREITMALTQQDFPEHGMQKMPLDYVTMTSYDDQFENVRIVFEKDNLGQTLGEILSENGKTQLRIAETEKYPHVTFFFSGGREEPFPGEKRIMIPSPKVATYDLQPQMSAAEVTAAVVTEMQNSSVDFVCLNFANADMVGHTGVFSAAVLAVEAVDRCLGDVIKAAEIGGYEMIILADHGNADVMKNTDGTPNTAHTTNPVPCILVSDRKDLKLKKGRLADVAPTLLELMNISAPSVMNGISLIEKK
jgi:2,3-bisphosphoglycerate-independent phosphoglycerate mutase